MPPISFGAFAQTVTSEDSGFRSEGPSVEGVLDSAWGWTESWLSLAFPGAQKSMLASPGYVSIEQMRPACFFHVRDPDTDNTNRYLWK